MSTSTARPLNLHRNSSTTTTSSSFKDLFTRPPAPTRTPSPSHGQRSNHIVPTSDFPPQTPRRPSSVHDLSELSATASTSSHRGSGGNRVGDEQLGSGSFSASASPKRSNSVRRKPVPALLSPVPNYGLPANHPFATSTASSSKSRLSSPSASARSSPSGGMVVLSVPDRQMGKTPPPPRRSTSLSRAERSPPVPPRSTTRLPASHLRNSRKSEEAAGEKELEDTLKSLNADDALHARMISLSLERPLSPTPLSDDEATRQSPTGRSPRDSPHPSRWEDSPVQPTTPPTPHMNRESIVVSTQTSNSGSSRPIGMSEGLDAPTKSRQGATLTHTPMPISVPMSRKDGSGPGSRPKSRSRIFRWDSTEKAKKAAIAAAEGEAEEFSVDRLPSKRNLWEAGTCFLRDEDGELVCFGDFFPRAERDNASSSGVAMHKGKTKESIAGVAAMEKSASSDPAQSSPAAQQASPRPILRTVVFFIRHFWCGQCQDYALILNTRWRRYGIFKSPLNVAKIKISAIRRLPT